MLSMWDPVISTMFAALFWKGWTVTFGLWAWAFGIITVVQAFGAAMAWFESPKHYAAMRAAANALNDMFEGGMRDDDDNRPLERYRAETE